MYLKDQSPMISGGLKIGIMHLKLKKNSVKEYTQFNYLELKDAVTELPKQDFQEIMGNSKFYQ